MIDMKDYITVREASKLTNYSTEYIRQLTRENKVDHQKIGTLIVVSTASLLTHKETHVARGRGGSRPLGDRQ